MKPKRKWVKDLVSLIRIRGKLRVARHTNRVAFRVIRVAAVIICTLFAARGYGGPDLSDRIEPVPPKVQVDEYNAQAPKTIIELQQFRKTTSISIQNNAGHQGSATLINLNPRINAWFLLRLQWDGSTVDHIYHLENPGPISQNIFLDAEYQEGIVMVSGKKRYLCDLWSGSSASDLTKARASRRTYAPLCDDRLYLRNKTLGHKTNMESVTDLLRKHVWYGEKITTFIREKFFQDAFRDTSDILSPDSPGAGSRPRPPGAPARPLINPRYDNHFLVPRELGIQLENEVENKALVGRWYHAKDIPGVYVSVVQPNLVSEEIIESQQKQVNPLDEVESTALTYMVAFDLDRFDLGFEMGTEHPKVGWSERVQEQVRDNSLPGPDGIGTLEPLVMTGKMRSALADRVAATFIGGFKRYHGAFRWSRLALKNHGSHYGFIENGVVMSKPQPGLATIIVFDDGAVDLKTWTEGDNADLWRIRHARQNGVPIIEFDEKTGTAKPGALVPNWGEGNWSGSADKRFRTLRAGICLQEYEGHRFLIYGYFSTATPSAMARVFQAYRCKYAMLLDMNALEHTYLAVYRIQDSEFSVQHLIKGMSVLDKSEQGQVVPRFIGYADNRDFFYLLRKKTK